MAARCEFCGKYFEGRKEDHIKGRHPERYEEWKAAKAEAKSRKGPSQLSQMVMRHDAEITEIKSLLKDIVEHLPAASKPASNVDLDDTFSEGEKKLAFWGGVFSEWAQRLGIKLGERKDDPLEHIKAFTKFYSDIAGNIYGLEKTFLEIQKKRLELIRPGGGEGFRKDKKGRYVVPPDELDELVDERYGEKLKEEAERMAHEMLEDETAKRRHLRSEEREAEESQGI